jgi:excisionase family DNA binding protein
MLLKAKQVAQQLNCGVTTVLTLARSGDLPAVKLNPTKPNSEWRFRQEDVEAFLQRATYRAAIVPMPMATSTLGPRPGLPMLDRICARKGIQR